MKKPVHQKQRTNHNYRRGADAERRAIRNFLKPPQMAHPIFKIKPTEVLRSAGSHGPFDLCVLGEEVEVLVQVKSVKDLVTGQAELQRLANSLRAYRKPRPPRRYLAGLVFVPREGWLVTTRYDDKVQICVNPYPAGK